MIGKPFDRKHNGLRENGEGVSRVVSINGTSGGANYFSNFRKGTAFPHIERRSRHRFIGRESDWTPFALFLDPDCMPYLSVCPLRYEFLFGEFDNLELGLPGGF